MRLATSLVVLTLLAALGGCNALPMRFENGGDQRIALQYLHKDYPTWSSELPFAPGEKSYLNENHYFRDVRGFRVRDGEQVYRAGPAAMRTFHQVCDEASLCRIRYGGNGRLRVSRG